MSVSVYKSKLSEKARKLRKSGSDFSIDNLNFKSLTNLKYTNMIPNKKIYHQDFSIIRKKTNNL